jgi:hypothetical protein
MLAKGRRRAFMALEKGENDDDEEQGGGGQQRREDAQEEEKRAVARAIERRNRSRETPLSQKWFKLKQKSITPAQKRILNELWPAYGLEVRYGDTLDLDKVFGRAADGGSGARKGGKRRRVLDIGFGTGDSIAGMAAWDIDGDFLGVELHRASIAAALEKFRSQVESESMFLLFAHRANAWHNFMLTIATRCYDPGAGKCQGGEARRFGPAKRAHARRSIHRGIHTIPGKNLVSLHRGADANSLPLFFAGGRLLAFSSS